MVSKSHTSRGPSIEDSLHVDSAAAALVATDSPVLVEGLGAVDGGLVVARGLVEIVGVAVVVDGAFVLASRAGVVSAVVLDDLDIVSEKCGIGEGCAYVVLNERAASPAVDAEVAVTLRAERTTIVDGSSL